MSLTSLHQQGVGREHVRAVIPRVQPWVVFLSLRSDLNTVATSVLTEAQVPSVAQGGLCQGNTGPAPGPGGSEAHAALQL